MRTESKQPLRDFGTKQGLHCNKEYQITPCRFICTVQDSRTWVSAPFFRYYLSGKLLNPLFYQSKQRAYFPFLIKEINDFPRVLVPYERSMKDCPISRFYIRIRATGHAFGCIFEVCNSNFKSTIFFGRLIIAFPF